MIGKLKQEVNDVSISRATLAWGRGATGFVLAGLLAALLQEFAIAPRILARENLPLWHGAGTAAYAVQWLCALVVLWKLAGPKRGS